MSAGVASVAEHEEVSGHRIEDGVDGHSRVCTAKDGAVGRLAALHQGLAHVPGGSRCCGRACSKAFVALLQQLQGRLGLHCKVGTGTDAVHAVVGCCAARHGRWDRHAGLQQLGLLRALPQEFHTACLQIIDATVDLNLTASHSLTDGLTEAQQKVHGVEDVHLDGVGRDGIRVCARTHFLLGLTGNRAQVLQQPLQRRARFLEGTLGIQKRLGGAVDGSALRVAEDQHQAAAQIARAEFQAAKNAAFCLSCLLRLSSNRFCNLSCGRQQPASNSDQAACVQVLPALRSTKMSPHEDKTRGHAGWKFQPGFMVIRMAPLFPAKHRPLRTDDFQAVKFAKTPPRHKQVHCRQDW